MERDSVWIHVHFPRYLGIAGIVYGHRIHPQRQVYTTEVWPIYWPLIRTDARASPVCISTVRPCNGRAGRAASRGRGSDDLGRAVAPSDTSGGGQRGIRSCVTSGASETCPLNRVSATLSELGATPRGGWSCKSCTCLCGLGAERSAAPGVPSATGSESLGMARSAIAPCRASVCEGLWGCAFSVLVRCVVPGGGGDCWSVSRGVADAAPCESGLEINTAMSTCASRARAETS